jgi:hypothetical protein
MSIQEEEKEETSNLSDEWTEEEEDNGLTNSQL